MHWNSETTLACLKIGYNGAIAPVGKHPLGLGLVYRTDDECQLNPVGFYDVRTAFTESISNVLYSCAFSLSSIMHSLSLNRLNLNQRASNGPLSK